MSAMGGGWFLYLPLHWGRCLRVLGICYGDQEEAVPTTRSNGKPPSQVGSYRCWVTHNPLSRAFNMLPDWDKVRLFAIPYYR